MEPQLCTTNANHTGKILFVFGASLAMVSMYRSVPLGLLEVLYAASVKYLSLGKFSRILLNLGYGLCYQMKLM